MDAQEDMHMNDYNKITALYSRLSVGDEDRDGGESNSIQNQKKFLESYARQLKLTNIRHYIDDDESGRFFDRSAYSRMIEDVENGKIGVCIMKDMTRWGRDYLQVGNAMEIPHRRQLRGRSGLRCFHGDQEPLRQSNRDLLLPVHPVFLAGGAGQPEGGS